MKFWFFLVGCLASFFPLSVCFGATSVPLDDGDGGRRVWMTRRQVRVRVEGVIAHTVETLVFQGGWQAREYVYTFPLPEGSVIKGLEVVYPAEKAKKGKTAPSLRGVLFDSRFVRKTIESTRGLPETPDPAWLEWVDRDRYRLRMVPEKPAGPMKVRLHYVHKVSHSMGRRVYRYPRVGADKRLTDGLLVLQERPKPYSGRFFVSRRTLHSAKPLVVPLTRIPGKSGPFSVDLWVTGDSEEKGKAEFRGGGLRDPAQKAEHSASSIALASVHGNPQEGSKRTTSLVFVVDVSRSMWKQSRLHSVRLLNALAGKLGSGSRFQLVTFAREPRVFFDKPVLFGRANLKKAARRLMKAPSENGTDVAKALKKAFQLLGDEEDGGRRLVVLLTDGLIPGDDLTAELSGRGEGVELVLLMGTRASEAAWELHEGVIADLADERGAVAFGIDPFRVDGLSASSAGKKRRQRPGPGKDGSKGAGDKRIVEEGGPDWDELAEMITVPGRVSGFELFINGKRKDLPARLRQFSTGSSFYRMFRIRSKSVRNAHVQYVYRGVRHKENVNVVRLGHAETAGVLRGFMAAAEIEDIEKDLSQKSGHMRSSARESGTSAEVKRIVDEAFLNARNKAVQGGIVSWASSLIVLDRRDAFAMDRYRFARRWGHRFFRRLSYDDSPDFSVQEVWRKTGEDEIPVEIVSSGKLTKNLVQRVIRGSYLKYAKACYEERIGLGATLAKLPKGRVLLILDLTRGEVARAELKNSELNDLKLEECLKDAAYRLDVPRSREDRTLYRIIYPLRFRPDDQAVEILEKAGYVPEIQAIDDPLHGLE